MDIQIRALRKADISKVISFAIRGMHFERYTDVPWALRLYGRYFVYMELERATQVLAAYAGDRLAGVLMAAMEGEPKAGHAPWRALLVKLVNAAMKLMFRGGATAYDQANAQMLGPYKRDEAPDGELCFLAADPAMKGQGVGSLLLAQLAQRETGKKVYLFTDNNCTYQFYERRGFARVAQRDIEVTVRGRSAPLTCFLYSKVL